MLSIAMLPSFSATTTTTRNGEKSLIGSSSLSCTYYHNNRLTFPTIVAVFMVAPKEGCCTVFELHVFAAGIKVVTDIHKDVADAITQPVTAGLNGAAKVVNDVLG